MAKNKNIHSNQISYRIGYRRGKATTVNAICKWFKQQDEMRCYELSMILGWDFIDELNKVVAVCDYRDRHTE